MERNSTTAPEGATAFTTTADAAILEAWDRRKAAFAIYSALPIHQGPGKQSSEKTEQLDIIDGAEMVIRSVTATTVGGVEVQLWCSLYHFLTDPDEAAAAVIADLSWFEQRADDFDWSIQLLLIAIHSLREQDK